MYITPKRIRWCFSTVEAAEKFAEEKRQTGARDVTVIPKLNIEDKARGFIPRVERADVCWTEDTTD
jgi:hypothetical protein